MSFASLLDNSCDIKRVSTTPDGQGGWTSSEVIVYSSIPCRFESKPRKLEILAYGGMKEVYPDYIIYIASRSGVVEGQLVIFKERKFEIKLIEDWSERGKYMSLHVVEKER